MNLPQVTVSLKHPPERVAAALLNKELEPFYGTRGRIIERNPSRLIKWSRNGAQSLLGKISYFTNKTLCVYRFKVDTLPEGQGTRTVLSAQNGPYSSFFRLVTYVVGLCMCVVGILFAIFIDKLVERGLQSYVENLHRAVVAWDQGTPV